VGDIRRVASENIHARKSNPPNQTLFDTVSGIAIIFAVEKSTALLPCSQEVGGKN
jgi:hypothetical protein